MRVFLSLAGVAALTACSVNPSNQANQPASQEAASSDSSAEKARSADAPEAVKVTVPQLAYAYALSYALPADKVADTQDRHRALCEEMGPARCQLLALDRAGGQDQTEDATMRLRVASNEASAFARKLAGAVSDAGGRVTDTKVAGEDVSKEIVDAKARIRQREVLVARLTAMLRNRTGKVADLVEAERSVAQAQEELDQTKAWLTELSGRVAMSTIDIRYTAVAASANAESVGSQLSEATQGSAANFLIGLRTLFTMLIYLLPWALLAFPIVLGARWLRRKGGSAPAQP